MARQKSKKVPLSNAERQAAYRERKKAAGLKRQSGWEDPEASARDPAPNEKDQLYQEWKDELKAEELKAARKEGRQKERSKSQRKGYLSAMISVCSFFIRRERPDIARALVKEFVLERDEFIKFQFGPFELNALDKAGVFDTPEQRLGKGERIAADP
jgi:hypothetical protein